MDRSSSGQRGSMIDGVRIVPLRQIVDERGKIMHILKATDEHFIAFGEIYFSCAWPGTIKAWHVHRSMTINSSCWPTSRTRTYAARCG
jgi:dTDP-4-dehydrorhamnose 3,5-epimerase